MDKLRLAILISGGGSTMEAVLRATHQGPLERLVEVAAIISSTKLAGGIKKAVDLGFPKSDISVCGCSQYESEESWARALIAFMKERQVDYFAQLGWMPKTPRAVLEAFEGVNQHCGALDPDDPRIPHLDFGGKGMMGRAVHAARLAYVKAIGKDFWTEATVHQVEAELDTGAVIGRRVVSIWSDDGVDELQKRVLSEEHMLVIETLARIAKHEATDIHREGRLVPDANAEVLVAAKSHARWLFPHG